MWIDTEAARSDFILAAAAYVVTPILVRGLLVNLPFYPTQPTIYLLLAVLWIWIAAGLTPVLLAGYRDDGLAAFGLHQPPSTATTGLLLAAPVLLVGVLRALPSVTVGQALLGRFSLAQRGGPTIPPDLVAAGLVGLGVTVLLVSGVVLLTFLSVRAEGGFRGTEMSLTEALRTFGMGAAGLGLLMGLLNAARGPGGWQSSVINALGLAALVLVADRIVPAESQTTRAAIVAPAAVVVAGFIFAAGGFIGGGLLDGLYLGSLGGGVAIVVASLVAADRAWAAVPMLAALAVYPTCLMPLVAPVAESFLVATAC